MKTHTLLFLTPKNRILFVFFCWFISANLYAQPEISLKKLQDGNNRFITGKRTYTNLSKERITSTSAQGQKPFTTILTCSDSRVPVEHIFDAGIGEIFVIRVAGNVCDNDEIATIEYGTEHLKTPLLVILGHSKCGAVTAVCRGDKLEGKLPLLIDNIIPAVNKTKQTLGKEFNDQLVEAAIKNNVWQSITDLLKNSEIVRKLVKENELKIEGAIYHIESGKIEWLGQHPEQSKLLGSGKKE